MLCEYSISPQLLKKNKNPDYLEQMAHSVIISYKREFPSTGNEYYSFLPSFLFSLWLKLNLVIDHQN